jgi:sugar-phosphatase
MRQAAHHAKRAAIFDMDGLLIDSEPLWREAEMSVFGALGIELSAKLCRQTTGLRVDAAVAHWHKTFGWSGPSVAEVTEDLLDSAEHLILEHGALMDGALQVIEELHARGLRLAIASSSPLRLIHALVDRFELQKYFATLHSAENEAAGKPDPAVYRSAILQLGVSPEQCIAFEDSLAGLRAAKAAGATVIAVPAAEDRSHPGFAAADMILNSLAEFSLDSIYADSSGTTNSCSGC